MSSATLPARSVHRLAFAITELEIGGAERCLTNLVLGLDRERIHPAVYSLGPRPEAAQLELVHRLEAADVPVHFLNLHSPRQFLTGFTRLTKLLADQQPHLIQSFLFHANVLTAFAGRRLKIPRTVVGIRVVDRSPARMLVEHVATRLADRVVCVSESVAQFARDSVRVPSGKICVIGNGISVAEVDRAIPVDPRSLGVARDRRFIVSVGRLHTQKGFDWLLKVARGLLQEFADVDWVIVGRGPEESQLRDQARQLEIEDRVHFVGWRNDVAAILRSAALLVLPSRWEGMPNVVLESMAARLPVVVTRVEGTAELLGDGANPQLADFGNDESLSRQIASILQDPVAARGLGIRNRTRVESEFSLRTMIERYQRLYGELLRDC